MNACLASCFGPDVEINERRIECSVRWYPRDAARRVYAWRRWRKWLLPSGGFTGYALRLSPSGNTTSVPVWQLWWGPFSITYYVVLIARQ